MAWGLLTERLCKACRSFQSDTHPARDLLDLPP